MSLRLFTGLASPPVVTAVGVAVAAGLPMAQVSAGAASLALLKCANVGAFLLNCFAVSVPGRIDGQQDRHMRTGELNPDKPASTNQNESTLLQDSMSRSSEYDEHYSPARGRTLVSPSGWAFAIWGPIYLGEAAFVAAQFAPSTGIAEVLPQIAVPFVAANIFQSLWCAAFRPSYKDWATFVSPALLAGAALSLSQVHAVTCSVTGAAGWWMLPMTVHFGWVTAASLVNLNGSVAMNRSTSDTNVAAVGHGSAIVATALGVGVTLLRSSPAYGLTIAWALAACADGMSKRLQSIEAQEERKLQTGENVDKYVENHVWIAVQNKLCWAGAAACVAASILKLI